MVVLGLRVFGHPAHRVDAVEERWELDRSAQRAATAFPAAEIGQRGVNLVIC